MTSISVITLNYFSDKQTIRLLNSLIHLKGVGKIFSVNVVIIDNGSLEKYLLNYLKKECRASLTENEFFLGSFVSILYIDPGGNLGFSAGCNKGYTFSKIKDPDFLFFVNNDAVLDKACLFELVHNYDKDQNKILSPKILKEENDGVWFEGGVYNEFFGYSSHAAYAIFKQEKNKYLSGCALFIPTEIFIELNGFDESYFFYGEDLDLSIRASKKGVLLDVCESAIAYHNGGGSIKKKSRKAYFYYVSGSLGVFLKHKTFLLWPLFVGRHLLKLIVLIVSFRISFNSASGYFKGLIDAFSKHANKAT